MNKSLVIQPDLNKEYPVVSHGKGIFLYDREGKQYIDACSGAVSASIGHGVEEIVSAMAEQAAKVAFAYRSQFTSEPATRLAQKISEWSPGDLNHVFFVNSGSEATETALKIAVQYWQERGQSTKQKVISRWMSYHGITLGALSMSGHTARRRRFAGLLADWPVVSPPYCYRCPFGLSPSSCQMQCAKELEQAINRIGAENIAAFIAEPITGASGGAVVPPPGYFREVADICAKYDILFIADEVMTGMGRTGEKFAVDHWGVVPDIIAAGKGLSGGYTPIAATIVSDRIYETIRAGSGYIMSGHTYSANPLSCAVSLAVIDFMEKHDLVQQAKQTGEYLLKKLTELASQQPLIGDVRGLGLLCGVELVANRQTAEPFPAETGVTERLVAQAFSRGLIIYPAAGGIRGLTGDAVLIAPPLTVKKEEIDAIIPLLAESIAEVQRELEQDGLWGQGGK